MLLAVALGVGPAVADQPRATSLPKATYSLGNTTVAFVCWPASVTNALPQLQTRTTDGWTTVAQGSAQVPAGWTPGLCPDAAFPVAVYYEWTVLEQGTPTQQPGINSLRLREFLPARVTQRTASYTLLVKTERCVNPEDGYRVRVTRSRKVPDSELPAKGSRFVRRCNGPVAGISRVPLKASIRWEQRDPAVRGPAITVPVQV